MRKLIVLGLLTLLAMSGFALAAPGHKGAPEFVPQLTEDKLTKIVFIRYVPGFAKDKPCNNDGICDADEKWQFCPDCSKSNGDEPPEEPSGCYAFLVAQKPRWNWVEPYVYNDESLEVPSSNAVTTWEDPVLEDIFGSGSYAIGYVWGDYDYTNSISFGDYEDTRVIAVAAVWFQGKNIYEYDIMFDTDFFPGDDTGTIDLDTVTLHEFGHGAGLGDLYDTVCSEEVMYGYYVGPKFVLQSGDITGIQKLYGA